MPLRFDDDCNAARRAVVFASLIPDPDDPECPDSFPALVNDLLPQTPNGEDTPRNRCLEFIKHLVKWENTNNEELIGKARKLIAAAHKFLHPDADGDMPKVLDPFAGGGAIPLEALRLGCEAHAIDLNPVAHLIELCTLVYPQKYGQPNSRPTPDYIKNLEAAHESKDGDGLFSKNGGMKSGTGVPPVKGDRVTQRNLPHWHSEGATYFLTWRCAKGATLNEGDRTIALSAIRHWQGKRWDVIAAVVMPDHVHVLAQALPKGDGCWDLSEILHSVKSFSAHEINKARKRKGSVWLDESFDRVVRDEAELMEKYDYIRNNPVKIDLVSGSHEYKWLLDQEEHRPEACATREGATNKVGQASRLSDTEIDGIAFTRLPLITETEYQKNPLATDVKFWGHWVLEKARDEIGQFYPPDPDGSIPVAYLWARTVNCPNPACRATIPLIRQLWLGKRGTRRIALRMILDTRQKTYEFEVVQSAGNADDPDTGTMAKGKAACPFCGQVADGAFLRVEAKAGRMGERMMAVVLGRRQTRGKLYRAATPDDTQCFARAAEALNREKQRRGSEIVPDEPLTPDRPSPNSRGLSAVSRYGFDSFGMLFNSRQALALTSTFALFRGVL